MITVLGLTFHGYGLILGLSIGLGWWLVMLKAKSRGFSVSALEQLSWWGILGGIVGARLYHVVTDFPVYANAWLDIFKIWQGGLSVIGAVLGGSLGVWLALRRSSKDFTLKQVLDLGVFGLPVAQALGRWGNYVNQELYGAPSTWPWAISIDLEHRLPGFEQTSTYHPLFAYEMGLLLIFAAGIWWLDRRRGPKIGSGQYVSWYLLYYGVIRFGLDFLRIDKAVIPGLNLGVNQVVMLGVIILSALYMWKIRSKHHEI